MKKLSYLFVAMGLLPMSVWAENLPVQIIQHEGQMVLLLPPQYAVKDTPAYPCKIDGLIKPCYVLSKVEPLPKNKK